MLEWWQGSEYWERCADPEFSANAESQAASEATAILDLCGEIPERGRVVDICCFTGRISRALAGLGYSVVGLDYHAEVLREAERLSGSPPSLSFVQHDVRLPFGVSEYDLAICTTYSFGVFSSDADDFQLCKNARNALHRSGVFFLEIFPREKLERDADPRKSYYRYGNDRTLRESSTSRDGRFHARTWTFEDGASFEFSIRAYSQAEIVDVLRQAGFEDIRSYGSLAGEPFSTESERHYLVARNSAGASAANA